MRILFLSELFYPYGSGAELATFLYADLLSKMGCDVEIVTNKFGGDSEFSKIGSFNVHRLPLFSAAADTKYPILLRLDILMSSFLRRLIRWSNVVYVPRFWFSAIPLAKSFGIPVVTHLHDYIPVCPLSTLYDQSKANANCCRRLYCSARCLYLFEKIRGRGVDSLVASAFLNLTIGRVIPRMVNLSDAVFCVSTVQKNLIVEKEPLLGEKTHVLYNPTIMQADTRAIGADFGYFGGYDYLKGFYVLLKALAYRKSIGSRPTAIHATKLESSATTSDLLKTLGILSYGKLDSAGFKGLYDQIRTVLVPSIWNEPWPYVVVEALINRRLVIASRIGGIPEQVEGCKGVFVSEPGDSKQLAANIDRVSTLSREEAEDLGWHNREVFSKRFNNESTIKKFISICDHLT
jgi:glycosyltransferase involved in cell wall biosynthesis